MSITSITEFSVKDGKEVYCQCGGSTEKHKDYNNYVINYKLEIFCCKICKNEMLIDLEKENENQNRERNSRLNKRTNSVISISGRKI